MVSFGMSILGAAINPQMEAQNHDQNKESGDGQATKVSHNGGGSFGFGPVSIKARCGTAPGFEGGSRHGRHQPESVDPGHLPRGFGKLDFGILPFLEKGRRQGEFLLKAQMIGLASGRLNS